MVSLVAMEATPSRREEQLSSISCQGWCFLSKTLAGCRPRKLVEGGATSDQNSYFSLMLLCCRGYISGPLAFILKLVLSSAVGL